MCPCAPPLVPLVSWTVSLWHLIVIIFSALLSSVPLWECKSEHKGVLLTVNANLVPDGWHTPFSFFRSLKLSPAVSLPLLTQIPPRVNCLLKEEQQAAARQGEGSQKIWLQLLSAEQQMFPQYRCQQERAQRISLSLLGPRSSVT